MRANPNRQATGAVLEARMQPGRGVVTNVIVRNGTLRRGDTLVCGDAFGTVRSIYNDRGEEVPQAGPGQPVAFSGLGKVPEAGEAFIVVGDADMARKVADEREEQLRRQRLRHTRPRVTLENLYDRIQRGDTRQLNVILKGDTQGSLDPLVKSLSELGNDEVSVKLIHSGVGDVNTSDVLLAQASEALILAYRVREDEMVRGMAAAHSVDIRRYSVIYDVADEVRQALEGLLEPEVREERLGVAEVRQTFRISHFGTVAGCYVQEGAVQRGTRVRVLREGQVIHTAGLGSLRQGKSDVRQVEAGRECGVNIEGFNDIQAGDTIECFQLVTVKRTLAEARTTRSETPES